MAAVKGEIYKCEACGNVVLVLDGGDGDLVCCGENMTKLHPSAEEFENYTKGMVKPGSP